MMKMLDRFMLLVTECDTHKKFRSPITTWKILHRKYEIIKEIKKKEYFSPIDLCDYGWIIMWAKQKWGENFILPEGFIVRGVENFYFYEYVNKDNHTSLHFCITTKVFKNITEVQTDIHLSNRDVIVLHNEKGLIFDKNIEDSFFISKIMREFIIGTINSILNHIIRGE